MFVQLLIFFAVEDVLQYFLHRLLHYSWLYQNIHKVRACMCDRTRHDSSSDALIITHQVHHHHQFPFGLTAAYAHWAEILILAIPTYGGPLLVAPHLCTMYLWIIVRELDSIHTHCGYEFPFQRLMNYIPFYGGMRACACFCFVLKYLTCFSRSAIP